MVAIDMGIGLEGTHVLITGAAGFIGTVYTLHPDPSGTPSLREHEL
jgi:hypothetical protein